MGGANPVTVRETAAQGWVYGHPMPENYRTLYAQAVDADDHRYVGGFGTFRPYPQPSRPENTDVVTSDNDTPCSWAWPDLRSEPWVVSVPAMDRLRGSLTLYVRHARPTDPDQAANRLPVPQGPFAVITRIHGPDTAVLDGTRTLPALTAGA
ncbi:DUF1254 domain-containing protein [Streptomyces sp. SID3343]|uniref:DUF1254 domain-containing protein n=1 Tax=Streptomyces sp. SID3343 TaxID=2690260 RepID=UPI001F469EF5|nr:DUF1254 domain-containing protein [Streptomyces sp. SID3343]